MTSDSVARDHRENFMSFSSVYCAGSRGSRGGRAVLASHAGLGACTGLGQRAGDSRGEAARRDPDAQDAVGAGLERRAKAHRCTRAQGQRVCGGNVAAIPEAKSQGAIPTLKMPSAQGWSDGQKPTAATGLKVNAFAKDLDHPRWINVLPNGDVLIAEIEPDRRTAQERIPLCDAGDDAARQGARRQRQPHHVVARPRR